MIFSKLTSYVMSEKRISKFLKTVFIGTVENSFLSISTLSISMRYSILSLDAHFFIDSEPSENLIVNSFTAI